MVISQEEQLEYQKAQDSAEHYNTMTWTLISIIFAFSLIILRTILLDINSTGWQFSLINKYAIINGILCIGTASWMYFGYLILGADQKKKFKYEICKKIERKYPGFLGQTRGVGYLRLKEEGYGIKIFFIAKYLFIATFIGLSILVSYRSLESNQNELTIAALILNIVLFLIAFFLDFKWQEESVHHETALNRVQKERIVGRREKSTS